jgi:hypothetical protein
MRRLFGLESTKELALQKVEEIRMALHFRDDIFDQIDADIYGTDAAGASISKYRMPSTGLRPDVAHALVTDFWMATHGKTLQRSVRLISTVRCTN